jgi:GTP cyclohydrolase I
MNLERIEELVRQLLIEIGEDPTREGLLDTPRRMATALEFLTSGYHQDIETVINRARFAQETSSMIVLRRS